ncbi:2-methoxy-6-polyprenyl-1,4-benzoquinol methylase, mitochondrial [Diaphorina citri]|uniref:2-methoxy-6-polyprenyl-1,4-benzoquinol methylase, mitochondrial n=1 Tax=Diaphorina citri TaxID=121845 RepID=A0A3Q0IQ41_DIACI|nr:2-methoxy-6-polyprenyl-1,4-benzoquinol methylase, mitochondrial [Diaphorina citri]
MKLPSNLVSVNSFLRLRALYRSDVVCQRWNHTSDQSQDKTTHFGFETVNEEEKTGKVYEVFENVAKSYDTMNDAMSFGIHRLWKDIFIDRLGPTHDTKLLDVAGGTGEAYDQYSFQVIPVMGQLIAGQWKPYQYLVESIRQFPNQIDIPNPRLRFLEANAEELPIESDSYSAYTIAFGIRNVTRIDKALSEAYRVLKPGGRFLCLEFSHVNNSMLQCVKEEFKSMIESAGFQYVTYENLTFGVVAIHSGFKL